MAKATYKYHFFLDEAGDTTFFGKGKIPIVGTNGVSKAFMIGMAKFNTPLGEIRRQLAALQDSVINDPYYKGVSSIEKKKAAKTGYFFHATDDIPEVRKQVFEFIRSLDVEFEIMIGRKIPALYMAKHNGKEAEFYADLLSHLIGNHLGDGYKIVLNIAERGAVTRNQNLQVALQKATTRHFQKTGIVADTNVVFNEEKQTSEPLLNIIDYALWAVQRLLQTGEDRYYQYIGDKIILITDLYDNQTVYSPQNPLSTENKL